MAPRPRTSYSRPSARSASSKGAEREVVLRSRMAKSAGRRRPSDSSRRRLISLATKKASSTPLASPTTVIGDSFPRKRGEGSENNSSSRKRGEGRENNSSPRKRGEG